uniref:Uncharacterized protein n=1 Tax=viral metagenome TaxID=1070528 RepID=A0A6C0LE45_9ZZZZ
MNFLEGYIQNTRLKVYQLSYEDFTIYNIIISLSNFLFSYNFTYF